ncbi:hypothetical protein BO99DRAFT_334100, partial [Aspergillus violaceofuscus CBS 115571]
ATPYIYASWALTAIAGLALLFRFAIKSWIRRALPRVSSPDRLWEWEDLFYAAGYSFDIAHIVLPDSSDQPIYDAGLGRHLWFLTSGELHGTLKNELISQPLAVLASMLSRTGMMCFLHSCFSGADRRIRILIVVCMGVQIIINMITVVQIIVQCGSNPYRTADPVHYFHYMWDDLPSDSSVICQSPSVQTMVGFVQGGFNSGIDLFLTALSAIQLWHYTMRATDRGPSHSESFCSRFRKIPRRSRNRRLWQTCALSGPLLLSGIASIIKTWLLKAIGERHNNTHNIVPFVLWAKIENYSILLATCAPIIRLLVSSVSNNESTSKDYPGSGNRSGGASQGLELNTVVHTQNQNTLVLTMPVQDTHKGHCFDARSDWNHGTVVMSTMDKNTRSEPSEAVIIRTDIMVEYGSERTA